MKHFLLHLTFFLLSSACFAQSKSNWEEIVKQDAMQAARRAAKEMGLKPLTKIEMAGEILSPGTSGLILQARPPSKLRAPRGLSVTYSDFAKPQTGGYICSLVRDTRPKTCGYLFRNESNYDPGYVADPFWMSGHKVMVMRFGRFAVFGRLVPVHLRRPNAACCPLVFEPNLRCSVRSLAQPQTPRLFRHITRCYLKHRNSVGMGYHQAEENATPFRYLSDRSAFLAQRLDLGCSYREKSRLNAPILLRQPEHPDKSDLLFERLRFRVLLARWKARPALSSHSVRSVQQREKSPYFLQTLQTGKTIEVPVTSLGTYSPERQIVWSNNSRFLLSVLNSRSYSRRSVLVYDTLAPANSFSLPVNASSDVYLLPRTPFKAQIGILYRTTRGEELNELGENKTDCSVSTLDLTHRTLRKRWSHTNVLGIGPYCVEWSQ